MLLADLAVRITPTRSAYNLTGRRRMRRSPRNRLNFTGRMAMAYAEDDEKDRLSASLFGGRGIDHAFVRIDRIDLHESTRKVRILTTKTSDRARSPEQTTVTRRKMDILALPALTSISGCRQRLCRGLHGSMVPYFNIPRMENQTAVAVADWTTQYSPGERRRLEDHSRDTSKRNFGPPVYPAPISPTSGPPPSVSTTFSASLFLETTMT